MLFCFAVFIKTINVILLGIGYKNSLFYVVENKVLQMAEMISLISKMIRDTKKIVSVIISAISPKISHRTKTTILKSPKNVIV